MKKSSISLTIFLLTLTNLCLGDIINTGYHYITKCNMVSNLDSYPEIALLAYTEGVLKFPTYEIGKNKCLNYVDQNHSLSIYTVRKSYIKGKVLSKLDLPNDRNAIKADIKLDFERSYVKDSIKVYCVEILYKIIGFTDTSVVLVKIAETSLTFDESGDTTVIFESNRDISKLSQQIPVGFDLSSNISKIQLFPNPVKKNLNLKINNGYKGKIQVKIVSADGKLARTLFLFKTESVFNYDISVANLPKGEYLANFEFDQQTETKRFMVDK